MFVVFRSPITNPPSQIPRPQQRAGKVAAELLAAAEHAVRLQPARRRRKTDGGQHLGDLFRRQLAESVDYRAIGRPAPRLIDPVAEDCPGDCAFAAARRPDDQTDPPVVGVRESVGRLHREPLDDRFRRRQIEHPRHLPHAERIEDRTGSFYVDRRHGN